MCYFKSFLYLSIIWNKHLKPHLFRWSSVSACCQKNIMNVIVFIVPQCGTIAWSIKVFCHICKELNHHYHTITHLLLLWYQILDTYYELVYFFDIAHVFIDNSIITDDRTSTITDDTFIYLSNLPRRMSGNTEWVHYVNVQRLSSICQP